MRFKAIKIGRPGRVLRWALLIILAATSCSDPVGPRSNSLNLDVERVLLSAGFGHACAFAIGGELYCWGDNTLGQLGDGTTQTRTMPDRVSLDRPLVTVTAGGHTCGIDSVGDAYCWGGFGQMGVIGNGKTENVLTPTRVEGGFEFARISAGGRHTCALTRQGRPYCWGSGRGAGPDADEYCTMGSPSSVDRCVAVPTAVTHDALFPALSAGPFHTCASTDAGAPFCWGLSTLEPSRVTTSQHFGRISTGAEYSCAITSGSDVFCWGSNQDGQLGVPLGSCNNESCAHAPVRVPLTEPILSVSAGFRHACAITESGGAYCWGLDQYGQLGDGDSVSTGMGPVAVNSDQRFATISAGGFQTCAVTINGDAVCWGDNSLGQLGVDGIGTSNVPIAVQGGIRFAVE